jgi:hypothetical protein
MSNGRSVILPLPQNIDLKGSKSALSSDRHNLVLICTTLWFDAGASPVHESGQLCRWKRLAFPQINEINCDISP